jgi:hypothetical protein
MKRPQGNILRPPGSKYINAKRVPARFGNLSASRLRFANVSACSVAEHLPCGLADTPKSRRWAGSATALPVRNREQNIPMRSRPKIAEDEPARLIDGNRKRKTAAVVPQPQPALLSLQPPCVSDPSPVALPDRWAPAAGLPAPVEGLAINSIAPKFC